MSRIATVIVLIILSSASFAHGQEPKKPAPQAPADPAPKTDANAKLRAQLDEISKEIEEIEAELATTEGENRAVLEDQRAKKRDELHDAVGELVKQLAAQNKAGNEDTEALAHARRVSKNQLRSVRNELKTKQRELFRLQNKAPPATPEELAGYLAQLKHDNEHVDLLLARFLDGAKNLERLEIDNKDELALIDKIAAERAEDLGSIIEFSREAKTKIAQLKAPKSDEEKAKREAELQTIDDKLDIAAGSLSATIELMKERDLDTTSYQKLLITARGQITTDVLDTDVALGLMQQWLVNIKDWFVNNGPGLIFKSLVFLFILAIFRLAAGFTRRVVHKALSSSRLHLSKLLADFFVSLAAKLVMLLGFLVALSQLGIELGPLLAGLGVVGFIAGFALQSTLSNFAAGLMILIYRPYDVDDLIEVGGVFGTVSEMTLVSTTLRTLDNQRIVVPNSKVWGDVIKNVTAEDQRRVDLVFGIGYGDDIDKAEKVLTEIVAANDKVLATPEPVIKLHSLGESSVDFIVRPWCKTSDYWDVHWDITREVKRKFDAEGITIPFPQRDVHIYKEP